MNTNRHEWKNCFGHGEPLESPGVMVPASVTVPANPDAILMGTTPTGIPGHRQVRRKDQSERQFGVLSEGKSSPALILPGRLL
jgi:hypothetical protein